MDKQPAAGYQRVDEQAATAQLTYTPGSSDTGSKSCYIAATLRHLQYFHALYKLKCQGVTNYVAVHSLYFIYKKGLKAGSKKAQTWEIT